MFSHIYDTIYGADTYHAQRQIIFCQLAWLSSCPIEAFPIRVPCQMVFALILNNLKTHSALLFSTT